MFRYTVKNKISSFSLTLYRLLLEYDTPKYVHVQSKFIGIVYRLMQLLILAFICLYMIWAQRGYQRVGYLSSITTSKVKGASLTYGNTSKNFSLNLWDSVDFVIPVKDSNTFFVTTSFILTPNQTISVCNENSKYSTCTNNDQCSKGKMVSNLLI